MWQYLQAVHFGQGHLDEALRIVGVAAEGDGHVSIAVPLGAARCLTAERGRHSHCVHLRSHASKHWGDYVLHKVIMDYRE